MRLHMKMVQKTTMKRRLWLLMFSLLLTSCDYRSLWRSQPMHRYKGSKAWFAQSTENEPRAAIEEAILINSLPRHGDTATEFDSQIVLEFDRSIANSSIDTSKFLLSSPFGEHKLARIERLDSGKIAISPLGPLLPSTPYRLRSLDRLSESALKHPNLGVDIAFSTKNSLIPRDITFGDRGLILLEQPFHPFAVGSTHDGEIALSGRWSIDDPAPHSKVALFKITTAGDWSGDFANEGKILENLSTEFDAGKDLSIQHDGKLLLFAAAGDGTGSLIYRYNPDGKLDRSFGTDGKIRLHAQVTRSQRSYQIFQGADGHIYLLSPPSLDQKLLRFDQTGKPVRSFGSHGQLAMPFAVNFVAPLRSGNLALAGTSRKDRQHSEIAILDPDKTTVKGKKPLWHALTLNLGDQEAFNHAAEMADGRILFSGYSETASDMDFSVAVVKPDGRLDKTFGDVGYATIDLGSGYDRALAAAELENNSILLAGTSGSKVSMAMLNTKGQINQSWGHNGQFSDTISTSPHEQIFDVIITNAGKVLFLVYQEDLDAKKTILVRYAAH